MTARLFVATWPDAAARNALAASLHVARTAAPDVRWQPPDRWHITLAFLGQADPEPAVRRISAHFNSSLPAPEPIHLTHSGTFGPVVWIGVEHGHWLPALAGAVQRALHVSDRRFHAHLTVGRTRGEGAAAGARRVAAQLQAHDGPPWTPHEVTLVESHGGPQPSYRILERWPLSHLS